MNNFKNIVLAISLTTSFGFYASAQNKCAEAFKKEKEQAWVESDYMKESDVLKGSLSARVEQFIAKYPKNARLQKAVKLKLQNEDHDWSADRDILILSTKEMNDAQKEIFLADYHKYLSYSTVSFPLGEGAGHLYTRFGKKTVDFYSSFYVDEFRFTSSSRLEPFVSLDLAEFSRLTTFLKNAEANPDRVLGNTDYEGSISGKRLLTDNSPTQRGCSGHNCTSWISTAGIGGPRASFMGLIGMNPKDGYGLNPGWWSAFLNTKASTQRVPFSVYMEEGFSVKDIVTYIKDNKNILDWNFNPH